MKHHRKHVGTPIASNASYGDIRQADQSKGDSHGSAGIGDENQPGRGQQPPSKAAEAAAAERHIGDKPKARGVLERGKK